jgi:hypothetical protein
MSNYDDPSLPMRTFWTWFLGLLSCGCAPLLSQHLLPVSDRAARHLHDLSLGRDPPIARAPQGLEGEISKILKILWRTTFTEKTEHQGELDVGLQPLLPHVRRFR